MVRRSRNVLLLGLVSFFTDVGSEMAMPLLPAFLAAIGGGAAALGIIEGIADAIASLLRLVAGRWADRIGRNRPFVIAGYGIAGTARPLIGLATTAWHVGLVRAMDRVGKGLRSSPRDVLIAASVAPERRAAAFGLHRAMDHAGAFVGPLVAFALIRFWEVEVRTIFLATLIPGAIALAIAVLGVREVPADVAPALPEVPRDAPPAGLWRLLLPFGLFTLANASELFLLLKAGAENAPLEAMPLLWVALHAVKATLSAPGGRLADRIGRTRALRIGWTGHAVLFAGLAVVDSTTAVAVLVLLHGVRTALTEGAEKALVSELAPRGARGAAFGWFHLVDGFGTLAANVAFGALWSGLGAGVAFGASAACAAAAVAALTITMRR